MMGTWMAQGRRGLSISAPRGKEAQNTDSRYSDSLGLACGMLCAPAEERVVPHWQWGI